MKKIAALLLICVFVVVSACSKEDRNDNDFVSQEESLSAEYSDVSEVKELEEQGVLLVEPTKTIDQVATDEESQNIIRIISQCSADDLATAKVYDKNATELSLDNQIMLLFQSESNNTMIYGYESKEYGYRGIIASHDDNYSYFDLIWSSDKGRDVEFYEYDFDYDDTVETAFCFYGGRGTGVSIYRLVIFDDVEGEGMLDAYEFTPDMQLEQFQNKLQFDVDMETKEINILKDDVIETTIYWGKFADIFEENGFEIDCLNQITYDISEQGIEMHAGIGMFVNPGGPTIFFTGQGGELDLEVTYLDGIYEIN